MPAFTPVLAKAENGRRCDGTTVGIGTDRSDYTTGLDSCNPFPSLPLTAIIPHNTSNMAPKRQKVSEDDPLTRALAPPPNETSAERQLRTAAEQEAKRVSDAIDDELNRQRIADKKSPRPVKILLLGASPTPTPTPTTLQLSSPLLPGQSESGMSLPDGLAAPTERLLHRKIHHAQE